MRPVLEFEAFQTALSQYSGIHASSTRTRRQGRLAGRRAHGRSSQNEHRLGLGFLYETRVDMNEQVKDVRIVPIM